MSRAYNGWTNKETWLVALWIDNEQPSYQHSRHLARRAVKEATGEYQTPRTQLAEWLEQWIGELADVGQQKTHGLVRDLLTTALYRVDWYEIAENYVEDVEEEATA